MVKAIKTWQIITLLAIFVTTPIFLEAATLSVTPASGTFEVGDRVTVRVVVSSGAPINAISGIISFPTSVFYVESISKAGSILNFWITEPNFSQGAGTLQFEGVTLGGFSGGTGPVVTATLRAVKAGSGSIFFRSGQVLANDGQGTDVTDNTNGATFSIIPPAEEVTPPPLELQESVEVEPSEAQPRPSLVSPEIMLTTKFDEKAISGTSNYPNSEVILTFVSEEGVKIFITGNTDNLGEFILLVPKTLKRGTYKVYAVVVQRNLNNSYTSNEIKIVIGNFLSDISWEIRVAILLLIALLIYLIVYSYHYLKKNKKLKSLVKKESIEAEGVVRKSFDIINEDLDDPKELKKDLRDAEKIISKEIKDIEKL